MDVDDNSGNLSAFKLFIFLSKNISVEVSNELDLICSTSCT